MHNCTHSKKIDEEMKRKKGEEIWEAQTNDEKKKEKKKERGWGEGVEGIKRPGSCTT